MGYGDNRYRHSPGASMKQTVKRHGECISSEKECRMSNVAIIRVSRNWSRKGYQIMTF